MSFIFQFKNQEKSEYDLVYDKMINFMKLFVYDEKYF